MRQDDIGVTLSPEQFVERLRTEMNRRDAWPPGELDPEVVAGVLRVLGLRLGGSAERDGNWWLWHADGGPILQVMKLDASWDVSKGM